MFELVLNLFELFSWLRAMYRRVTRNKNSFSEEVWDKHQSSIDENSRAIDCSDLLQKWYDRPSFRSSNVEGEYDSRRHRNKMLVACAIFEAYLNVMARLALRDRNTERTAAEIRRSAKYIQLRAAESERFYFVFEELIRFLRDVERSSTVCIINFIKTLARDRLGKQNNWVMVFWHTRCRSACVPKSTFEGTMAVNALFHQRRAGFDPYYIDGDWKKLNRAYNGAITMLMIFAFEKLAPSPSCPLVENVHSGVERILKLGPDFRFVSYVPILASKRLAEAKDLMMWDISRNCCNEFVESSWSPECLERVIWTLCYGMRHVNSNLYNELRAQRGRRNLDLTPLSPLALMAFSISGMIRFRGRNDGPYSMTESADANVELHGTLPMPSIQTFLDLNLVRSAKKGAYILQRLPGLDRNFKAISVGDKLKFVESVQGEMFNAELQQLVV